MKWPRRTNETPEDGSEDAGGTVDVELDEFDPGFIDSGMASHIGGRQENQDRASVSHTLGVVSDGMGGYAGGAKAAELTVAAVRDALVGLVGNQIDEAALAHAFERANDAVRKGRRFDPEKSQMGATLTLAALVRGDLAESVWLVAHVGDSPAFLVMSPEAVPITIDHTVPAQMVSTGALSSADAEIHPYRHVLLRAIGTEAEVHVDLAEVHLAAGDALLIASDGLSNELAPADILPLVAGAATATEAAEALVREAVDRGASDNVTAVVLRHLAYSPQVQEQF
jgi:protein phosphatase